VGIVWFYLALAVESSIFPIRDIIFEHRVYLPSAGFFLALTASAALLLKGRRGMTIAWALLVTVCLLLGSLTIARNRLWREPLLFWQDAAAKSPNKYLALANLGDEYLANNMPEKALPLLVRAMELHPNLAIKTKVHIGDAMRKMGLFEGRFTTGAEFVFPGGVAGNGVLDYKHLSAWDSVVDNNVGLAYEYLREPEKALKFYKLGVVANPAHDLAWYNLGLLAAGRGEQRLVDDAVRHLQVLNPQKAGEVLAAMTGR
jgi:tetratricopeptide (TPR) repeat protein